MRYTTLVNEMSMIELTIPIFPLTILLWGYYLAKYFLLSLDVFPGSLELVCCARLLSKDSVEGDSECVPGLLLLLVHLVVVATVFNDRVSLQDERHQCFPLGF